MKDLGHIAKMRIKIESPMKMDFDTEYQALCIMVGQNGSGKSLILKLNWALNMVISTALAAKAAGVPGDTKEISQYIFDKTFFDQDFDGEIVAYYVNGTLEIHFDKGKVIFANYSVDPEVKSAPTPIFMSTQTRTFDQIKTYLQISKDAKDISEYYRLYDILYIERLRNFLKNGVKAPESFKSSMKNFGLDRYDFDQFVMDDTSVYFLDAEGKKRDLATLSKGEQSLVNMILMNSLA